MNLFLSSKLLQYACDTLYAEIAHFRSKYGNAESLAQGGNDSEEAKLLTLTDWLANDFQQRLKKAGDSLPEQAKLLQTSTDTWNLFQVAWQQRMAETDNPKSREGMMSRFIAAGNSVARSLYQVAKTEGLNLIIPNQLLIVVSVGGREYSRGFETPTPFIVSPYWGHSQVWTWLSYAHEVGHHIYRNVLGLSDELKVNVTLQLMNQTAEQLKNQTTDFQLQYRRIWFNWLEEIFADIFGLMRIGPAFAHTQQFMLAYLPESTIRPEERNRLLVANDVSHPLPYLRVYLTILALQKLQPDLAAVSAVQQKWDTLVGTKSPSRVYVLDQGRVVELEFDLMKETADYLLDVILDTELDALAKISTEADSSQSFLRRSLKTVFFNQDLQGVEKFLDDTYQELENLAQQAGNQLINKDIDELSKSVLQKIVRR